MFHPRRQAALLMAAGLIGVSLAHGQSATATAALMKADTDFAQSVADRDRARFQSFLAPMTTFDGGTENEIHGREAVLKEWDAFFAPDGPSLTWAPTSSGVTEAGDVGYTMGRSIVRRKTADGRVIERQGRYLTVWRKQPDGGWRVVFDTGSTLP